MKPIFFIIIFASNVGLCQNTHQIDSLLKKSNHLQLKIEILNDSLKIINSQISKLKSQNLQYKASENELITHCTGKGNLKLNPISISDIICPVPAGTKLVIKDYSSQYFGVRMDTLYGYIHEMWIEKNDQIKEFIKLKEKEEADKKALARQNQILELEKGREEEEKYLIKRYGEATYLKIIMHKYWIGMSSDIALLSLGYPDSINRSVGSWGVHEQWVFNSKALYLYFENEKLSSYQERK